MRPLHLSPKTLKKSLLVLGMIVCFCLCGGLWHTKIVLPHLHDATTLKSAQPEPELTPDSQKCASCHPEIFSSWSQSDHAWAHRGLQSPLDAVAFQNQKLTAHGTTLQFMTTPQGRRFLKDLTTGEQFFPEFAIGRVPLVQYLIKDQTGAYHTTSAAWDTQQKEWFDMFGKDSRTRKDWGHWLNKGMVWNTQCAWCHTTDFQKKYDIKTHTYHSTWKEPGVTCLQCHTLLPQGEKQKNGCLVSNTQYSMQQIGDNCGTCHSRREELNGKFRMGDAFDNHFVLVLPTQPNTFYANGMQQDEDYTMTGLKLSRMGKAGVQCIDCHDPHSAKLKRPLEDNSLCLKCHNSGERNAPIINEQEHTHHPVGSMGNRCVECHMPESPYMERDPRRDHALISPDPQMTLELGIPNACNMCHKDQTAEWAAKQVKEWYKDLPKTNQRERTRTVHKALMGELSVPEPLIKLIEKEDNPYWRATLITLLDAYAPTPQIIKIAQKAVTSDTARERYAATLILGQAHDLKSLSIALEDQSAIVRQQAAWELRDQLPESHPAMKELEEIAKHQADQPSGALKLAQIYTFRSKQLTSIGQTNESEKYFNKAKSWYKKAIEWDKTSPNIRQDFAIMLAETGNTQEAIRVLQEGIRDNPLNGQLYYLLALAEAEQNKSSEAYQHLSKCIELDPQNAQAYYNRALLQQQQGQLFKALQDLGSAYKINPHQPEYLYTQAYFLFQSNYKSQAKAILLRLEKEHPSYENTRLLLQEIENFSN